MNDRGSRDRSSCTSADVRLKRLDESREPTGILGFSVVKLAPRSPAMMSNFERDGKTHLEALKSSFAGGTNGRAGGTHIRRPLLSNDARRPDSVFGNFTAHARRSVHASGYFFSRAAKAMSGGRKHWVQQNHDSLESAEGRVPPGGPERNPREFARPRELHRPIRGLIARGPSYLASRVTEQGGYVPIPRELPIGLQR